jgi:hypothetical protein
MILCYSGAKTPTFSLKGLRVHEAACATTSQEIAAPPGPRRYWTRRDIAGLIFARLAAGPRTLVGLDHGFSFPLQYFGTALFGAKLAIFP